MAQIKKNYHRIMLAEIAQLKSQKPKLLLHSCCAPCSSYVLQFLSQYFEIEVFFFNPNIYPEEEYIKRLQEEVRLIKEMGFSYKVISQGYQSQLFYEAVKGYEKRGEGSERCFRCFKLRLEAAAKYAKTHGLDYFTTTLTISPLKNAEKLNEIGLLLQESYGIKFLPSDFKKNNGYQTSITLSKQYHLYRQNYCGCIFSQQEAKKRLINIFNI